MALSYYPHMGHLWFLGNIFIYVIALVPVFILLKKKGDSKFKQVIDKLMKYPFTPFLVNILFVIEAVTIQPNPFAMYAETLHGFVLGLLCFFFGFFFMYIGKSFWQNVLKWRWLYLGVAAILFAVRFMVYATETPGYLMVIESNSWIFAVFGFCHKHLNKPSKILSYLSTAAYPVYIIHMIVLYGASYFILPLKLPVYISFPMIVIATFGGCYTIYELIIRRIPFLKPFFGLRWNFKLPKRDQSTGLAAETIKK